MNYTKQNVMSQESEFHKYASTFHYGHKWVYYLFRNGPCIY